MSRYEAVIGLEVHCQLKTASKLFCACSTAFGAEPNHNTCPICLGYPGVLPVLNRVAVDLALRMALAIGAKILPVSVFSRKQYFYPDQPKGYQITQYDLPYCSRGSLSLASGKVVDITRIHLEEDAGKSVHTGRSSFVDLNRAGIPLIEIVSEPVMSSPEEAGDYLRRLRALARYLDISDGNMEEGSFRCDANVSIRQKGETTLRTRTEIKNVNSFRNVERAIAYEIMRQTDMADLGQILTQQTLQFDAASGRTLALRLKENAHDYRYFPDPDLKPLYVTPERIALVRAAMPELAAAKAQRYCEQFGLNDYDAAQLTADRDLALYFEAVQLKVAGVVAPKMIANWMLSELMREVNERSWDLANMPIPPENFAKLLQMISGDAISGKIAKVVFDEMCATGQDPETIVAAKNLVQVVDEATIQGVVDEVISAHPAQVAEFVAGKGKVLGFFVGQIMRRGQGAYSPALVNAILMERLNAQKQKPD